MKWKPTIENELAFLNPSKNLATRVNSKSVYFNHAYKGRTMIIVKPPKKMPMNMAAGAI